MLYTDNELTIRSLSNELDISISTLYLYLYDIELFLAEFYLYELEIIKESDKIKLKNRKDYFDNHFLNKFLFS